MMSQESVPSSLPDTQNTDILTPASQQDTLVAWGRLCPMRSSLRGLEMTKNEYTLGRIEKCDIILSTGQIQEKYLNTISKVHFRIYREHVCGTDEFVVYLEDLSHNGTFVDKIKVGRGNRVIIENNSEIALTRIFFTVYQFVFTSAPETIELPIELKRKYALGRKLGTGACGEVRLIFTRDGTQKFAMKTIKKDDFNTNDTSNLLNNPEKIKNEVEILKKLKHSCIIQMEEIYDTPETVYIILELMEGGELFDRIKKKGRLSESCAKLIFYQVVLAVHYLHSNGITHRDLKPENILLATDSDITVAKVSDFGLSKLVDAKSMMKTFCGTPMYVAPEILMTYGRYSYTSQVDVWSLGVILYVCLSGIVPFRSARYSLEQQIKRGLYNFPQEHFGHISRDAIELIKHMMTVEAKKRITIQQILLHPWLRDAKMREVVDKLIHNSTDENSEDDERENSENVPPPNNYRDYHHHLSGFMKRARLNA